jgi:hypothetical protein
MVDDESREQGCQDEPEAFNPDDECFTNGCHDEWTHKVVRNDIDRAFGYCEEHAEMWERLGGGDFEIKRR